MIKKLSLSFSFIFILSILFLTTSIMVAVAGSSSTTMRVGANVIATCNISASDLVFGVYTGDTNITANSNLTVKCTNGTTATILLDGGLGGGTSPARIMTTTSNPDSTLIYTLKTDDGTPIEYNANSITTTGTGNNETIIIHGEIEGDQDIVAGNYTDTVTVTIQY